MHQFKRIQAPRWHRAVLRLAGVYNLLWGAWVVLFPLASLRTCGYSQVPTYPEHWQCIGMIVGVYGIGYWIAASDSVRHWPIVLVGLLGKIFGPIGFVWAWSQGDLPLRAGSVNVFNDVIWWVPFTLILLHAWREEFTMSSTTTAEPFATTLARFRSQQGETLLELSQSHPVLLLFVRHDGCTFCREALAELAQQRSAIEAAGQRIAIAHMGQPDDDVLFKRYQLDDVPRFSDPEQQLYQAFDLKNATWWQLFNPVTFWRGMQAALFSGHGFGPVRQNVFRMPGAFILHHGKIVAAHRHKTASERLNFEQFACGLPGGEG